MRLEGLPWTPAHAALIKTAAEDPLVQRIFVNPAIKRALCRDPGHDRAWMSKVRAYWGHDYHFHVRLRCPADSPDCKPQDPVQAGDWSGFGTELDALRPLLETLGRPVGGH